MEKTDVLDEFLISWKNGSSLKAIEQDLLRRGADGKDVLKCKKAFEMWIKNQNKKWSEIRKLAK